jgi:hypothetical protein
VWLKDTTTPADLQDEDPEVFSMYLRCVYFGKDALDTDVEAKKEKEQSEDEYEEPGPDSFELPNTPRDEEVDLLMEDAVDKHIEKLVKLSILADKLGDPTTTNIVMDELVRFCDKHQTNPVYRAVRLAYDSTTHSNPLRKFMRDSYLHECDGDAYNYLNTIDLPADFFRDIYVEFLRVKDHNAANSIESACKCDFADFSRTILGRCYYHKHDDEHPVYTPAQNSSG